MNDNAEISIDRKTARHWLVQANWHDHEIFNAHKLKQAPKEIYHRERRDICLRFAEVTALIEQTEAFSKNAN